MSPYAVRRLRSEGMQVSVYNSAGTIFLYDDGNTNVIRQARPSLLGGYYGIEEQDIDAPLLLLGEKGALMVFELWQDDELQAEVNLGPPLDETEAAGIPWSKPQRSFLSLPGGILCIESMDCLRLADEEPADAGARLTLPPGDYIVSLQCLSPNHQQDPDNLIPEYFISMVPLAPGEPRPANRPFLAYPREC